jgi:hypothetical protein
LFLDIITLNNIDDFTIRNDAAKQIFPRSGLGRSFFTSRHQNLKPVLFSITYSKSKTASSIPGTPSIEIFRSLV